MSKSALRNFALSVSLALTPELSLAASECTHTDKEFRCVDYIRNYDGDTLSVNIPDIPKIFGKNIRIRVAGVDTPEIKGVDQCEIEKARIAKKLVEAELRDAKRIDLKNIERDQYFRIVADLEYDGKNLKEVLFKNKLAVPYNGGHKNKIDWCSASPTNPGPSK